MARGATIQLKVHRQIVQSIPLDDADVDCLIQGLRLVRPLHAAHRPPDRPARTDSRRPAGHGMRLNSPDQCTWACLDSVVYGETPCREQNQNNPMDHRSFRAQLVFSIGFALSRSRELLRRVLREHAPDDARRELAERVVKDLEGSGFELDEQARALRQRPPTPPHSTPD